MRNPNIKAITLHTFLLLVIIGGIFIIPQKAFPGQPALNFSDIDSGPKTGNTDGAGGLTSSRHGAIVTVWGNYPGSSQGSSKIYVGGVEAAHVYSWKDADGSLPGGPLQPRRPGGERDKAQ